ncbi:helix-turn-helix transcriptional regulator [Sphingomonas sp. R86520]|uniref:S24 family peptidase n=1 Tax=Sphingomonas sp. R86520 TaxID=3093859 RepID=UPI0036D21AC6
MNDDSSTPLQIAIRDAVAASGRTRDANDQLLKKELNTTGKPLWDIERGKSKKPGVDTLRAIERVLGLREEQLVGIVFPRTAPAAQPRQEPDQPPMRKADDGTVSLKVVDLNLAMGDGGNLDDWADEESVEFDLNLLRSITRSPAARVIVVRPRGDSMFPTLLNGDWVLIDTTQRTLNLDDKIWACSVYGAGAVKRLKAIGKGKVEVRSDNPIAGNREVDAGDLIILGRVIWIGREA